MKTYIIFIILGFTHSIICSDLSNITYDESDPVCPVKFFRKKRALAEYTRWRANTETTPEFLVKVLDDELTTSVTKPIVAVNIQPLTKEQKIIVGGVILPTAKLQTGTEGPLDYTRFVPPTTLPVSNLDDELYLAPQVPPRIIDELPPIRPKGRNSHRDESPPASPQFLARTPPLLARQYAPIAPVAFTVRTTLTPRKPPTTSPYTFPREKEIIMVEPIRTTSTLPSIIWPIRTPPEPDDFKGHHNFLIEESNLDGELSERPLNLPPKLTSVLDFFTEEMLPTKENAFEENKTPEIEQTHTHIEESFSEKTVKDKDKDMETIYNMMFYSDEKHDVSETYEDKFKSNEETTTSQRHMEILDMIPTEKTKIVTEMDLGEIGEEEYNVTKNMFYKQVIGASVDSTTLFSFDETGKNVTPRTCSLVKLRQLNFNSPRTLAEIDVQLTQWAEKSPIVKWEDITAGNLTTMENPIHLIIVDDPSSGQIVSSKQTVMIVGGIQGRDHHAVAAAMYVLYQLIERSDAHSDLLSRYRFWVIPVFNPDGYDYSMTFTHQRDWTKNLRQNWEACNNRESCKACAHYGLRCTVQPCYGVNLDRNFEYQWIPTEELRSEHPCGSLYAGVRQLSEEETRALTNFLHQKRTPLSTFIAFKEGEVLGVMYPYSHTRKLRAFDHVYRQRASRAASAAYSISGRPYVAGQTSEFLPLYAGGIEDWVDGHLGIDNTYTIMMFRPTDSYNSKLVTERVVHEAYAAMDTLLLQSASEPLPPPPSVNLKRIRNGATKTTQQYHLIAIILAAFISLFAISR